MPTDCSVLRTPTILHHNKVSDKKRIAKYGIENFRKFFIIRHGADAGNDFWFRHPWMTCCLNQEGEKLWRNFLN